MNIDQCLVPEENTLKTRFERIGDSCVFAHFVDKSNAYSIRGIRVIRGRYSARIRLSFGGKTSRGASRSQTTPGLGRNGRHARPPRSHASMKHHRAVHKEF